MGAKRFESTGLVAKLLVGFTLIAGGTASAQTGPVAAYGFEEASGAAVVDSSGQGNNGTLGSAIRVAGRYGNGLQFDGVSARVTVPDSASLDLTSGMTLEAWLYPTSSNAAWKDVIYKGPDDIYYLEGASTQGAPAAGGTFAPNPLFGTGALPVNTWSHLGATYDGATVRLYVNGAQVASRSQPGVIATSNGQLTFGGDALYGQYFQGLIDEVRIYNRALTAAQIQSDMNTPIAAVPPDTTPPTVSIQAPSNGSQVTHVALISAAASDDKGVLSVEFDVDGTSIGTDATAPYAVGWNTTTYANGNHTIVAVARDLTGNQTTSSTVVANVVNPSFVNEVVVPDITAATTIAFLPDGRMLVGEITETIWVVQPGANQPNPAPFLSLDGSRLIGEQGLMDILPDRNFATNGWYYIFYTRGAPSSNNHNRVSRFTASGNGTVAGSEVLLWEDDIVAETEHHAGSLAFGNDGKLYITYGDQFFAETSQQLTNYRGKVLRINLDGTVPTDNPFYDGGGPNKDQIWAYGLRNPFRMSIDATTGRMFIGDVGGNDASTAMEEINLGVAGANYGWPLCEGSCALPGLTGPIHSYPHSGRDAAVMAGIVYRGSQFPSEYVGSLFFGDYVQNTIKRLVFDANGNVMAALNFWPPDGSTDGPTVGDPVKFQQGPDGSLYYVDLGFNDQHVPNPAAIRRIRYAPNNAPPVAVASAAPTSGPPPLQVSFSSSGSYDPEGVPLGYLWTFGDGTTSTQANPIHTYATAGPYVARLSVSDGVSSTLSSNVSIAVGSPPSPVIFSPQTGAAFRAGNVISFSGAASDPEEGQLGAGSLSWTILFHHDGHIHPGAGPIPGSSGTFTIPTTGHDFQGTTNYEIILTATDSTGLSSFTSVTIVPDKVNLSFTTVPSGLGIDVNAIRKQTPFVLDELIGFNDTIAAPDQTSGTNSYHFQSWSDGGAQSHTIVAPASNQSYAATFQATGEPGLVAAYAFNEGSGTTAADASGNGNPGTITNATWTVSGKNGGALVFNGTSARVRVNDAPSLDLTNAMTLAAWVRPSSVSSSYRDVIYKGDDLYYLEGTSTSGGAPAAGGTFSGSPVFGTGVLAVNTWTHLAASYDGAALRLYVNGAQVASRPQTGPIATSTLALEIGGDSIYGQYFAGTIDDVRIYNRALSASEVQTAMNTAVGGSPPPPGDTQPPTAPGNLAATAVSTGQINLTWSASTDNVGVTAYRVERQGGGSATFTEIGTSAGTSFSDTGLSATTTYSYRVRAADAAGNLSAYSGTASATTQSPPADTQPPTAPGNLAATAVSTSQINLSWTAATDNVGVTAYRVERQGGGSATFSQIGTGFSTSFIDTGLTPGTTYSYRVRATDAAGNLGAYSGVANATTQAAAGGGLVAAYAFNEGSGTTTSDASGNGNTGAIGTATWTPSGKNGGALVFNGTTAKVTVNDSASLDLTTAMTLAAWVKPSKTTKVWRDIVFKGDDLYYLEATSTTGPPATGGTFSGTPLVGTSTLGNNKWAHVAASYDGATLRLYVNGAQVASRPQTGPIATSNLALEIGGDSIDGQFFAGTIDDVRIYDRALSASEIQAAMNAPVQ